MAKYNAKDWDEVRKKFAASLMVDTPLTSLAQNLEIKDWPISGDDEKPSKYVPFNWEELMMLPEIAGKQDRVDHLVMILKETLAFDDPFGDMAAQVETESAQDNPILKTLSRLGIPEAYPLNLVNLSEGTRAVCSSEGIKTIGEFANLGQQMSTRVVLGGDFRTALNVLSHGDEEGIGQFLPFRKGSTGLHLAEAACLAASVLPRADQVSLAKAYGSQIPAGETSSARSLSRDDQQKLERAVLAQLTSTLNWFKDDKAALEKQLAEGLTLGRYLAVVPDRVRETIALKLLPSLLQVAGGKPVATGQEAKEEKKGGFFSRLFKKG